MNRFLSRTSPSLSIGSSLLRAMRAGELFFEEDDGKGGGGSGSGSDNENGKGGRPSASEIINRYNGDTIRMADKLADVLDDNHKLRGKRDRLQAERDDLKGKVPGEGAVVLTKEQATDWNAYQTLLKEREMGKAEDVKKALDAAKGDAEKVTNLQGEIDATKRGNLLRDVAEAAGYKYSVLADRDKNTPGLAYEVKDATVDGKAVKQVVVKWKEGEGESATQKEQPLGEFAAAKWADFLPALQAQALDAGAVAGGVRVADQGSGGKPAAGSHLAQIRARNEAAAKKAAESTKTKSIDDVMGMGTNAPS